MTPAAAADIVDATWYGHAAVCRHCRHRKEWQERVGPWYAETVTADVVQACRLLEDAHADPFDCPAVEAELDKECAE